jgi:hypothetical protein
MNRKLKIAALACWAASACAGIGREARHQATERLEERGVETRALAVESGGTLTFVNADARPHQIYSPDCGELSSTPLQPGQSYTARLGVGPKVCHFQDLFAPLASDYFGVVEVSQDPRDAFPTTG